VPYWTHVAASLALASGPGGQHLAEGKEHLATALWGTVDAAVAGAHWQLDGTLSPVPWAREAAGLVVAVDGDLFFVDPGAPGVELVDEAVITGEPACTVHLAGAEAAFVGDAEPLRRNATILICATMLGTCEEALAMTARHVGERQQFGSPIGTFQAVAHRCADAYIDTEAVRLTTYQAAWQLDAGEDAAEAVAVAALWACDAGHRVLHAAQHLHGGIGMDTDYPLHRYFRWATVLESLLGGPHEPLRRLGTALAAGDVSVT
jgi:alkylation response protein AidB-like acyl-CoA dehydrogenase